VLDTFLLSCRVLGRAVEDVFLGQALKLALKRGCQAALGKYCPTPKNGQVAGFYLGRGFAARTERMDQETQEFYRMLDKVTGLEPSFVRRIESDVDQREKAYL
jgi:predicted enzyme involved in methoxymalonyl-ACP biosynthesis